MSGRDDVLVAGGGIGGLTVAVALEQAGVPVRVFEQASALREVGAGVSLWPNAMRALAAVGLDRRAPGAHVPMEEIVVRRRDGTVLLRLREPGRQPEPGICVHRATLQRVLADALPGDRLCLDCRVVDFEPDDDGVTATFHDGSTVRGRLLVGADGIRSTVRARLHGSAEARYRGYEIWRGVSDLCLPDALLRRATEWWAPGRRFGVLPGEPGRVYWYATHTTGAGSDGPGADVDRQAGNRPAGDPTAGDGAARDDPGRPRLRALFCDWPAPVPELVDAADTVVRTDAEDRPVPRRWGRGPVTLLGDAAHPMTPNMGQGACTAIEDAVVLARCVEDAGPSAAALRRYEAARRPRTAWIVRQSRRVGRLGQMSSPVLVAVRDQLMRLTPERLLQRAQRRVYDWQ